MAVRTHLGKNAYAFSPEGPGVSWNRQFDGLDILTGKETRRVNLSMPKGFFYWGSAVALPGGTGFLVLFQVPTEDLSESSWSCALVGVDGSVDECVWPGGAPLHPYDFYLAADGCTVRLRRQEDFTHFWFESWNVRTGAVVPIERVFLTYLLRHPSDPEPPVVPCDMGWSRLSPHEDAYAVACTLKTGEQTQSGLWTVAEGTNPRLLLRFTQEYRGPVAPPEGKREAQLLWEPRETYGLAWSPDQRAVYFCGGEGNRGLVVSVQSVVEQRDLPCLVLPSWSPDGARIAGVLDGNLQVVELAQ